MGVGVAGGTARIERVAVRDLRPNDKGDGGVGLAFMRNMSSRANVEVFDSAVANTNDTGIVIFGADATIRGCAVRDTSAAAGLFGDAIAIAPNTDGFDWFPASATIEQSLIERAARGGVAAFGMTKLSLGDVRVACTRIPLVVSPLRGEAAPVGPAPELTDLGGTFCGCGTTYGVCRASAEELAPTPFRGG
jgi:hypothetical protein